MTKTNYEQKKRECWEEFRKEHPEISCKSLLRNFVDFIFDRAYALGKHEKDAEGEEMLTCEKSKVQRAYNTSREIVKAENPDSLMYSMHTQIMCVLENIFGSKCLPDANEDNFVSIEPKPAEPKEDKHFDNILKDGFHDHNRLHIASIIMSGLLASGKEKHPVRRAMDLADALIAEAAKGESK